MPTAECIEQAKRPLCSSDCIMPEGKIQVRCCDCDYREIRTCGILEGLHPGMKQCDDCSFPEVII